MIELLTSNNEMKDLKTIIKKLIISGVIALLLLAGGLFAFSKYLDSYTLHNVSLDVPDIDGFHLSELDAFFDDKDLEYVIIDSIYNSNLPKGIVVDQNPAKGNKVKPGRKIYLTINRLEAPMVRVPDFKGETFRSFVPKLKRIGVDIDTIITRPSDCDCVIGLFHKGIHYDKGFKIARGESVALIQGIRSNEKVMVPVLYGKTLNQVKDVLFAVGLGVGQKVFDEGVKNSQDSANAFVFSQNPEPSLDDLIRVGESIDLKFTLDSNKIKKNQLYGLEMIDSLNNATQLPKESIDEKTTQE